jgi:Thioesterase-like superfamily
MLELHCGSPEFMPARMTVDLFRAARGVPTTVGVRVVCDGRRVCNAECDVLQDGRPVAHAILAQYRRSTAPPGQLWAAPVSSMAMPVTDDAVPTNIGSDEAGWGRSPAAHQNASRKRCCNKTINVPAGDLTSAVNRLDVDIRYRWYRLWSMD